MVTLGISGSIGAAGIGRDLEQDKIITADINSKEFAGAEYLNIILALL